MIELTEKRQENSKTYNLGGNERQLLVSTGAIHFKDNYADLQEPWKDIDLNWEGNRITKAPYELTHEDLKLTIRDKKTGEVSTIELLEIGGIPIPAQAWERSKGLARAFATGLEIVAENSAVRYARILESDQALLEAKYKIITKIPFFVKARDKEGILPVEWSVVTEILTETLKPDRPVKYPVRIDPTWRTGASSDDCFRNTITVDYFSITGNEFGAGYTDASYGNFGCAGRFLNVNIPSRATIVSASLMLTCLLTAGQTAVNTRLRAELSVSPATFSNAANFDARTWTTAYMNWDAIPTWTKDVEYTSPTNDGTRYFKDIIQEVANLGAITHLVILWDDFQQRSTQAVNRFREGYSYNASTTKAPQLAITYTVPVRGWWSK